LLDVMLPERPIGSTTLAMLVAVGISLIVARVVETPRLVVIGATAFVITYVYEGLLMAILAAASGVAMGAPALGTWTVIAIGSGIIAAITGWVIRSLLLRFGAFERVDW
jgi:hypothetical protein